MHNFKHTLIALTMLGLLGCAAMSKDECMTKDWHQAGFADGANGQFKSQLAKERKACAKYNVAVSDADYAAGWAQGVRTFCTPSKAMQMGISGQKYNPICPADLANNFEKNWRTGLREYCNPDKGYDLGRQGQALPDFCAPDLSIAFNSGYQDGFAVFQHIQSIKSELNEVDNQIHSTEKDIRHKQGKIDKWMGELQQPEVLHDRVAMETLRVKIRENNHAISSLNRNLSHLQHSRARIQARLSQAEAQG